MLYAVRNMLFGILVRYKKSGKRLAISMNNHYNQITSNYIDAMEKIHALILEFVFVAILFHLFLLINKSASFDRDH